MPLILGTNSIKDTGYDVANSLRFDNGSAQYLTRTCSAGSFNTKYTVSFWFKLTEDDDSIEQYIYMGGDQTTSNNSWIRLNGGSRTLYLRSRTGGSNDIALITNRVFRDPSAWYHIVYEIDTTLSTASDRVKLYINGVQETSFSTATYPAQNTTVKISNNGDDMDIGRRTDGTPYSYFTLMLAEYCVLDGQALDQTSFGEFDEDTGIWKPINVSGLTFGTNGFYLDFENSGSLGADVSGNGNNFTVNNLTSIDQTTDTPTNNYCTLNPLYPVTTFSYSDGNCKGTSSSSYKGTARGTIGIQDSGKWFFEVKITSSDGSGVGISAEDMDANTWQPSSGTFVIYLNSGNKVVNGTSTSYGATYGDGDIIGVAYNSDDAEITFYKNGVSQGTITGLTTGKVMFPSISDTSTSGDAIFECNFGNPTFTISSGNSDGNGYGNFEYSVPSGYYALNTKNLAEYG